MRLDQIPWEPEEWEPFGAGSRRVAYPTKWSCIVLNADGTYFINVHAPDDPRGYDREKCGIYFNLDPATAQAVLFHIFGNPEGNDA